VPCLTGGFQDIHHVDLGQDSLRLQSRTTQEEAAAVAAWNLEQRVTLVTPVAPETLPHGG